MRRLQAALAAAAFLLASGAANAAEVVVLRGDTAESVTIARNGPTVLRGGGTMLVDPPKDVVAEPKRRTVYAGDTLWLVGEGGPVVACYLTRTEYADRRKITCTDRRY